jgi:hypothetical protein
MNNIRSHTKLVLGKCLVVPYDGRGGTYLDRTPEARQGFSVVMHLVEADAFEIERVGITRLNCNGAVKAHNCLSVPS